MKTSKQFKLTVILALLLAPLNGALAGPETAGVAAPAATTWYVDHAATGTNTGGSWTDAFTRLQPALDQAQPGDQVWVATGIYTPTNAITRTATFTLTVGVALYGGFDPAGSADTWEERDWQAHATVLSGDLDGNDLTDPNGVVTSTSNIVGNNAYHVLSSSGLTQTARLDGFYVTSGKADGGYTYTRGGGMYNYYSSPSLADVTFSANQANDYGGGMCNQHSSPSLSNVTFTANLAGTGGGMYNGGGKPFLLHVTFNANLASYGGGMSTNKSQPTLADVTFVANYASNHGGGMHNSLGNAPILFSVVFAANLAGGDGGGIYNDSSNPKLTNAIFIANQAGNNGGGMYNGYSSPSLANVIFEANLADYGGGMANLFYSSPSLANTTFAANQASNHGGGIYNFEVSNPKIYNSILWGNAAGGSVVGEQVYNDLGDPSTISFSDVQGGCPSSSICDHLINVDPNFVHSPNSGPDATWGTADDDYGNLHLGPGSPAINAGSNALLPADSLDLDGDGNTGEPLPIDIDGSPRIMGLTVDMGADEAWIGMLYLPVVVNQ